MQQETHRGSFQATLQHCQSELTSLVSEMSYQDSGQLLELLQVIIDELPVEMRLLLVQGLLERMSDQNKVLAVLPYQSLILAAVQQREKFVGQTNNQELVAETVQHRYTPDALRTRNALAIISSAGAGELGNQTSMPRMLRNELLEEIKPHVFVNSEMGMSLDLLSKTLTMSWNGKATSLHFTQKQMLFLDEALANDSLQITRARFIARSYKDNNSEPQSVDTDDNVVDVTVRRLRKLLADHYVAVARVLNLPPNHLFLWIRTIKSKNHARSTVQNAQDINQVGGYQLVFMELSSITE